MLFLDRDGVIIRDAGYAKDSSQVHLIPGIDELIRRVHEKSGKVIVVTNQSGLGRGWITLESYQAVSGRMLELLAAKGVSVDAIYFSPFYEPEDPGPNFLHDVNFQHHGLRERGVWSKNWRKPMPGMIQQAALDHDIDLSKSILIGDRATDQVAGALAGLARTYFLKGEIFEAEMQELTVWRSKYPELKLQPVEISHFGEVQLP
jgi:D-glycero-D-manno-heptose 1,7-bisphosphate phosphatase